MLVAEAGEPDSHGDAVDRSGEQPAALISEGGDQPSLEVVPRGCRQQQLPAPLDRQLFFRPFEDRPQLP